MWVKIDLQERLSVFSLKTSLISSWKFSISWTYHNLLDGGLLLLDNGLVQLHPSPLDNEHGNHESDDELDDEDDPAGQHVVRVGHNLLHAPEGGAHVHVEGLCGEESKHACQDITVC